MLRDAVVEWYRKDEGPAVGTKPKELDPPPERRREHCHLFRHHRDAPRDLDW